MDLLWVMFTFFIFITIAFIIIGLFFPEWVGITGDKAREIQRHQQDDSAKPAGEKADENTGKKASLDPK